MLLLLSLFFFSIYFFKKFGTVVIVTRAYHCDNVPFAIGTDVRVNTVRLDRKGAVLWHFRSDKNCHNFSNSVRALSNLSLSCVKSSVEGNFVSSFRTSQSSPWSFFMTSLEKCSSDMVFTWFTASITCFALKSIVCVVSGFNNKKQGTLLWKFSNRSEPWKLPSRLAMLGVQRVKWRALTKVRIRDLWTYREGHTSLLH